MRQAVLALMGRHWCEVLFLEMKHFIARTAKDMYQWISSICQLSGRDAKSNLQEEKPSTSVYVSKSSRKLPSLPMLAHAIGLMAVGKHYDKVCSKNKKIKRKQVQ
uniref:Uncharacterized protein n=1 Tax=Timema douglasi TaxID=61478 RepID=A0A7R8Z4F2_TIMDO|nr:unnamed protein product [Timema douglasi]